MKDTFVQSQTRLSLQIKAMEQLDDAFLQFLWNDTPATPAQLRERHDRLIEQLDLSKGMDAGVLMHLFERIEQKAFDKIRKLAVLAQTTDLDAILLHYPELPPDLIEGARETHQTAYKKGQSKQAKNAAKKDRPGGRHRKRETVEKLLEEWVKNGLFVPGTRGDVANFIKEVQTTIPEISRESTIRDWVKEYLSAKGYNV